MNFNSGRSLEILSNTPDVLKNLLKDLSSYWITSNEGPDTWSPFDIVGHLVHIEKTDWMERLDIILHAADKNFKPVDRFAMFTESKGKTINDLLNEFRELREKNLAALRSLKLSETDLVKKGIHPKFGEVTLKQLLSTWTVHDLSHLAQICRVMAKQYKEETGPWVEYLPILSK